MAKDYNSPAQVLTAGKLSGYDETVEANERNPIVSVYLSILNLGAQFASVASEKKYIRSTNFIAFNSFVASLAYLTVAVFWENWFYFNAIGLLSMVSLATLFLNGYGRVSLSKGLYMYGINTLVFLDALYCGPESHSETFLILSVVMPFLIYNTRKVGTIILGFMYPIGLLLAYQFVQGVWFTNNHLAPNDQLLIKQINVVVEILLLLSAVFQLVSFIRSSETELESSNTQMMLQTSELKRSNSDLEQFAYIISHDLKTPVRNISSFMNLLLNKYGAGMNPEALEFVNYSHLGAKRLERLIDDVLAYCRIGTNLPNPIPVNLNDVANTIRFELRDKMAGMNAVIQVKKELPVVNNVHASLMYHVFQNLITNGLKFNKTEQPEININCTNSLNYYTFSIQDNGIGISKEYSTTIFQMFKRLHNEHEYDGTGIGLAICKKIVEYYHGEIWFESEPGKGTTFFFTIRKF